MKKVTLDIMAKYLVAGDIINLDRKQIKVEAVQNRKDNAVFIVGKKVTKKESAVSKLIEMQPDEFVSTVAYVDSLNNKWYHPNELTAKTN
ncbi:hypothetical protein [Brevibacillus sp. NRS-1366]|uniref:hypothetical protein n=1 Tax=Brevibacillus sp. NRS-1366 TaxID=3233899 RepID=UPI003D1C8B12